VAKKQVRRRRTLQDYLAEQMRNPRFRRAWDEVQEEDRLTRELVRLRVEQGLTQAQVAQMLGTKQGAISRLEHRPPTRATELLRKVAHLYGYEVRAHIELVPSRLR
jgi:DNA-directed RNA polymerase specialized sigma subunit